MGLIIGGVSAHDLVLDGHSVSLYVGGSPPVKVWPTTNVVQITLGTYLEAQVQLRAALSARGLDHTTVTEIPFDIELIGTGSTSAMFYKFAALTSAPEMDTSQVTDMSNMFQECSSLTTVPDMDTSSVTSMNQMFRDCSALTHVPDLDTSSVMTMRYMFYNCAALTDGNVRLIGRHPQVDTTGMINNSGLSREPFYDADGQPWPTAEVHEVSLTDVSGRGVIHPLLTVTVPAGETWDVRIQGTMTQAGSASSSQPQVRIGSMIFGPYGQGEAVDCSGTVTSADNTIAIITNAGTANRASFSGTVTIEK